MAPLHWAETTAEPVPRCVADKLGDMRETIGTKIGWVPGVGVLGGTLALTGDVAEDLKGEVSQELDKVGQKLDRLEAKLHK